MKTGDVIGWIVVDAKGEPVAMYGSRSEAREAARGSGGRIARVVLAK